MDTTEQLPPHSFESEQMFLSCCLQSREAFLDASGRLKATLFYDLRHLEVWREMERKESIGEHISATEVAISFTSELRTYVFSLGDLASSGAQAPMHLAKLIELEQKRGMIRGCHQVQEMARNGHSIADIAETAEGLLAIDVNAPPLMSGKECGRLMVDDLEARYNLGGKLSGIDTGFPDLNEMNDGWQSGELTIIGARPSIGKTAIGLMFFAHCVFRLNIPALFYSLEMSTAAIMRRLLAIECRIGLKDLRKGNLTEKDFERITRFNVACSQAPMHIIDTTSPGISEVCATIRRAHRKHGVRLVVGDYLQKIKAADKSEKRTYEVAEVSSKLKGITKKLGIAQVWLAQLNRESEKDKGRQPKLADLADSAQIERDADLVGLLYRERTEAVGIGGLIIAKQRDGETGHIGLSFQGHVGRFESLSRSQYQPPTQHDQRTTPLARR